MKVWVASHEPYHDNSILLAIRQEVEDAKAACQEWHNRNTVAKDPIRWEHTASGAWLGNYGSYLVCPSEVR